MFRDQCLQSGKPAASGGFVAELEVEPAVVELVLPVELVLLLPLRGLVVLPELVLVLGVSLRTCFVTLSQHFVALEDVVLGEVVVVEVWAAANPTLPTSIAAAINPIPVIRMRRILFVVDEPRRAVAGTSENGRDRKPFLAHCVTKAAPASAGNPRAATPRRHAGETPRPG